MSYSPASDNLWLRRAFYLPKVRDTVRSSASQKYTDTTLGGNIALNSPPQFTPIADPVVRGRHQQGAGMGRYYAENIDDSAVHLHMRAGVGRFNSFTQFFIGGNDKFNGSGFYDPNMSYMARTGRGRTFLYNVGRAVGWVFTAPLQVVAFVGSAIRFFIDGKPSSRWYNLKPTMGLYWSALNSMVNTWAIYKNINPPVLDDDNAFGPDVSGEIRQAMHRLDPRVFKKDGRIDMYAVANKAQRLSDSFWKQYEQDLKNSSNRQEIAARMDEYLGEVSYDNFSSYAIRKGERSNGLLEESTDGYNSLEEYMGAYLKSESGKGAEQLREGTASVKDGEGNTIEEKVIVDDARVQETYPSGTPEEQKGWWSSVWDSFWANTNDASEFVTFNVRSGDSVSESVSNSASESSLAQTLNNMSSGGRARTFDFSGGNIGDNWAINRIEDATRAVMDLGVGLLDSVGMSGLAAFNGAALLDIPKFWEDSTVSFPRMSYKLELRAPYNHPYSQLQNEIVPLLALMAFALPRSTGKQSYTSPFLVEAYCQGRGQVRLGLVDSLSITRGVNNMAWSKDGTPRGIDVDISIMDLSSIMSMPLNPSPKLFDDENAFSDYMATLGGLSLGDHIYQWRKFNLQLSKSLAASKNSLTPDKLGHNFSEWGVGRMISAFRKGIVY